MVCYDGFIKDRAPTLDELIKGVSNKGPTENATEKCTYLKISPFLGHPVIPILAKIFGPTAQNKITLVLLLANLVITK